MIGKDTIFYNIVISCELQSLSQLLIGDGSTDIDNQINQYIDVNNKPRIPASSLKGALLALSKQLTEPGADTAADLEWIFGKVSQNETHQLGGKAGRVRFLDAIAENFDDKNDYVKVTRTKINPITRTADDGMLFSTKAIKPEKEFTWLIKLDKASYEELTQLYGLLLQLENSAQGLGRHTSSGAGKLKLVDFNVKAIEASNYIAWLKTEIGSNADEMPKPMDIKVIPAQYQLNYNAGIRLQLRFKPITPYFSASTPEDNVEITNIIQQIVDDNDAPFIAASSLRGALRARASKILASRILEERQQGLSNTDILRQVDELLAPLFGNEICQSNIIFEDAKATLASSKEVKTQYFNAIDRFTGGVKEGALYAVNHYPLAEYHCCLTLNHKLLVEVKHHLAIATWCLVMRDLIQGDIHLGAMQAKGFGKMAAEITLEEGVVNQWSDWITQWDELVRARSANYPDMQTLQSALSQSILVA